MADSEVLTIELIGALLGIGTDKETYMDAKLIQKYEDPPNKWGYFLDKFSQFNGCAWMKPFHSYSDRHTICLGMIFL